MTDGSKTPSKRTNAQKTRIVVRAYVSGASVELHMDVAATNAENEAIAAIVGLRAATEEAKLAWYDPQEQERQKAYNNALAGEANVRTRQRAAEEEAAAKGGPEAGWKKRAANKASDARAQREAKDEREHERKWKNQKQGTMKRTARHELNGTPVNIPPVRDENGARICPIHGCEMRPSKFDKGTWYCPDRSDNYEEYDVPAINADGEIYEKAVAARDEKGYCGYQTD